MVRMVQPFLLHFCITCHNKKVYNINSQPLGVLKLFPWGHHICKYFSKKAACHLQKQKKTQSPKFYFLPSKLKLAHKNWFKGYSSSITHTGDKKAILILPPKPQEHTLTRWREIAYGHWAHPGQRSHISPIHQHAGCGRFSYSVC